MTKNSIALVTILGMTLLFAFNPAPAFAQDDEVEVTPAPAASGTVPTMSAGARIELIVASEYDVDGGGEADGEFGVGFGFMFDYKVWDYVKVGADLVFATVSPDRPGDRDTLLNIGVRGTGFYPLFNLGPISTLLPYGFLTMGMSGYIPDQGDDKFGFWIEGGAGAELIFGSFGAFSEFSVQGNINDDYTYTGFQITFGGKYYF